MQNKVEYDIDMYDDIKQLVENEGGYQSIEVGNEIIHNGWRGCEERWDIIKPYVQKNTVVMDIGSHYGYFSKKISDTYEDCLVWSIEADERRAEIQRQMLEFNGSKNIVLTQHKLDVIDFLKLSRIAEGIDTILMLSVIHYFDDIPEIIWLLSKIAPTLIIEVPVDGECEVAERENVDRLKDVEKYLNCFYKNVDIIGTTQPPVDDKVRRIIFRAENIVLNKDGVVGYIGGEIARSHNLKYNSTWKIDNKRKWHVGLNVYNLLTRNVLYPTVEKLKQLTAETYFDTMKAKGVPTDISYRNAILTPFGINVIDYKDGRNNDIYGVSWQEYKNKIINCNIEDFKSILQERF